MVDKNPFEKIMDQVAELLITFTDNQGKILDENAPPFEIHQQLEQLENDLELFKKITDEALRKSGISDEEIARRIADPKEIRNRKDKRVVERASKLKGELSVMEKNLGVYVRAIKMGKKKFGKKKGKRKSKFKRLGGDDKGWLPL